MEVWNSQYLLPNKIDDNKRKVNSDGLNEVEQKFYGENMFILFLHLMLFSGCV